MWDSPCRQCQPRCWLPLPRLPRRALLLRPAARCAHSLRLLLLEVDGLGVGVGASGAAGALGRLVGVGSADCRPVLRCLAAQLSRMGVRCMSSVQSSLRGGV